MKKNIKLNNMEVKEMEDETSVQTEPVFTSAPKFTGNLPVALWEKEDKNGKKYFTLKIGSYANLFEVKKKEE